MDAWLKDVLVEHTFLAQPFLDSEALVAHSPTSFLALLREIVRGTNHSCMVGSRVVQLPSGLSGIVADTCSRVQGVVLDAFDISPAGLAMRRITGAETREWLARAASDQADASLASFDGMLRGFARFPACAAARAALVGRMNERSMQAEARRAARAQGIAEADRCRAALEAQRAAEARALAEAELRRTAEEAQRLATEGLRAAQQVLEQQAAQQRLAADEEAARARARAAAATEALAAASKSRWGSRGWLRRVAFMLLFCATCAAACAAGKRAVGVWAEQRRAAEVLRQADEARQAAEAEAAVRAEAEAMAEEERRVRVEADREAERIRAEAAAEEAQRAAEAEARAREEEATRAAREAKEKAGGGGARGSQPGNAWPGRMARIGAVIATAARGLAGLAGRGLCSVAKLFCGHCS